MNAWTKWGVGAGVALGLAYALSPLAVWFAAAMAGLFYWAGRGLPASERRWVFGLLAAAVALRLLAVAGLFLSSEQGRTISFFWDGDGVFMKMRAMWIRDVWMATPVFPRDFGLAFDRAYGWTTYLYVLAYIQYLVGLSPYGIHLFNVAVFLATAVALYRLVRPAYGALPSLLGLALLLFLPSLFFWSVSALKESLYVFLAVIALVAAVTVVQGTSWRARAVGLIALAAAVAAIGGVRVGATLIVTLGLAIGFAGGMLARRPSIALLLLVLLPFAVPRGMQRPAVQASIQTRLVQSGVLHLGNVRTQGHSYRLLDQHFYSEGLVASMTPGEQGRFVVRALVSFLIVPLPWQAESGSEMIFVGQQMVWYLLVVFAVAGFFFGLRRDPLVTCMLAGFAVIGGVVIALNSGNIGTMVRHRDTVVPFVLWLSALGAVSIMAKLAARTSSPASSTFDAVRRTPAHAFD
jgi:hypothetical protein